MRQMLTISSWLAIAAGVVLVAGGIWAICFTYKNVEREHITTTADASIPNTPVRGPLTILSQADIIRTHTLEATSGKTFAEMPRMVPMLTEQGTPVLDAGGEPVLVENTARDIWITATTLMTALNLGIVTYAFSSFVILFGLVSIWTGLTFHMLRKRF